MADRDTNPSKPTGTAPGLSEPHSTGAGAQAKETAREARHEMHQLKEEAKERGKALFEGQKHTAADEIGGMANALRRTAQQLNEQDQPSTAHYAERAADALGNVASTLRDRDFGSLIKQTEDFARRQPGIFFGGSVVTGFLLARFLKSSSTNREAPSESASEGLIVYGPTTTGPGREGQIPPGME